MMNTSRSTLLISHDHRHQRHLVRDLLMKGRVAGEGPAAQIHGSARVEYTDQERREREPHPVRSLIAQDNALSLGCLSQGEPPLPWQQRHITRPKVREVNIEHQRGPDMKPDREHTENPRPLPPEQEQGRAQLEQDRAP